MRYPLILAYVEMTFHLLGSELFPCLDKKFKVQEIPKRRCLRLRPKESPFKMSFRRKAEGHHGV